MTSSFLPCSPMSTILVTKQAQSLMLGTGTLTWGVYCFLLCNTALNLRMNTSGPAVTRSSDRSTQSSTRFMRKCCLMLVLENRNDPLVDTEKENNFCIWSLSLTVSTACPCTLHTNPYIFVQFGNNQRIKILFGPK